METQSQFLIDSQSNTYNLNNWLHNVFFLKISNSIFGVKVRVASKFMFSMLKVA